MNAEEFLAMRLKENLEHLLKTRGMTVSSLARLANTPKTTLADWMSGTTPKDLRAVKRVAEAFGISIDHLAFGDVTKSQSPSIEHIFGDNWVGGLFEVQLRRVKK